MTTKRSGLPEVWATAAAKYLVGENPCLLRVWFPAHHKIDKARGDETALMKWKVRHTEQLTATIEKWRANGWRCGVEKYFRVTGLTSILAGKVDVIAQKADERPTIIDCKGGKPEDTDVAQVQIYQYAIPRFWRAPEMQFNGLVVYDSHGVQVTPAEAKAIQPALFSLMVRVGKDERPEPSPSEHACKWCPVSREDCPDRVEQGEEKVDVLTSEF